MEAIRKKRLNKGDVLNQEQFFEAMGEEGARLEYERINDLLFKYEDKNNRAALEMAFADPDYTQYKDVLDANLLRMYPDGKIPLERITNYAEVMNQGAKKKIQKTVFDIEDIVFAGNDAERELIVNLNGDLRSFSLPKEIEPLQEGIAGLLPPPKTTGTEIVERKPKEENIEFLGLKQEDVFKTITKPDGFPTDPNFFTDIEIQSSSNDTLNDSNKILNYWEEDFKNSFSKHIEYLYKNIEPKKVKGVF